MIGILSPFFPQYHLQICPGLSTLTSAKHVCQYIIWYHLGMLYYFLVGLFPLFVCIIFNYPSGFSHSWKHVMHQTIGVSLPDNLMSDRHLWS